MLPLFFVLLKLLFVGKRKINPTNSEKVIDRYHKVGYNKNIESKENKKQEYSQRGENKCFTISRSENA